MLRQPEVLARLQDELNTDLGSPQNQETHQISDVEDRLPYMRACVCCVRWAGRRLNINQITLVYQIHPTVSMTLNSEACVVKFKSSVENQDADYRSLPPHLTASKRTHLNGGLKRLNPTRELSIAFPKLATNQLISLFQTQHREGALEHRAIRPAKDRSLRLSRTWDQGDLQVSMPSM